MYMHVSNLIENIAMKAIEKPEISFVALLYKTTTVMIPMIAMIEMNVENVRVMHRLQLWLDS